MHQGSSIHFTLHINHHIHISLINNINIIIYKTLHMHKMIRIDVKLIGSDVSYPGFGSPPRSTNPKGPPDPGHHVPCDGSWPQSLDGQCLALEE